MISFDWSEIEMKKCPDRRTSSLSLLPEEKRFLDQNREFFLLDLEGKTFSDKDFYDWLFKGPDRHLVIGPAIGVHSEFKKKAKGSISLSSLTLTHGLAQIVLAETLFRAVCRLKNHPFIK